MTGALPLTPQVFPCTVSARKPDSSQKQRVRGTVHRVRIKAAFFKHQVDRSRNVGVVFANQDEGPRRSAASVIKRQRHRFGQLKEENGPHTDLGCKSHVAAHVLHDGAGDIQA